MEYKNILNEINNNEEYDVNQIISERPHSTCYVEESLLAYLYDLQLNGNDDEVLQEVIAKLEKKGAICTEFIETIELDASGSHEPETYKRITHVRNKYEFLQSRAIAAIGSGDLQKLDRIVKHGLNLDENLAEYFSFKEYSDGTGINVEEKHEIMEMKKHPLWCVFRSYPGPSAEQRVDMIKFLAEKCNNINREDIKDIMDIFKIHSFGGRTKKVLEETLEEALAKIEDKAEEYQKHRDDTILERMRIDPIEALEGASHEVQVKILDEALDINPTAVFWTMDKDILDNPDTIIKAMGKLDGDGKEWLFEYLKEYSFKSVDNPEFKDRLEKMMEESEHTPSEISEGTEPTQTGADYSPKAWVISDSEENKEFINILQESGQHVFVTEQGEDASYEGLEDEIKEFIIRQGEATECKEFEKYAEEMIQEVKEAFEEDDEIELQEAAGIEHAVSYIKKAIKAHEPQDIRRILEEGFPPISSIDFYGKAYYDVFDEILENDSITTFLNELMNNPPETIMGIGLSGSVSDVTDLLTTTKTKKGKVISKLTPGVCNIPLSLGKEGIMNIIKDEIELSQEHTPSEIAEGIEPTQTGMDKVMYETIEEKAPESVLDENKKKKIDGTDEQGAI